MESRIEFAGLMPHAPVLVPSVGGNSLYQVRSTAKAMTACAQRALEGHPETVVVISPHSPRRSGAFGLWHTPRLRGSFERFGAPEETVDLPLDRAFAERLELEAGLRGLSTWRITRGALDHGALVPLYYLAAHGWVGPTVVLGLDFPEEGGLDEIGRALSAAALGLNRQTAIIASGDMSHRLTPAAPEGYDPEAHRFDETFVGLLRKGAFGELRQIDPALQERAAEDVMDSTRVALAASDYRTGLHNEVLSYEGPFGVGYCVAVFLETGSPKTPHAGTADTGDKVVSRLEDLPEVARRAVEAKLRGGPAAPPFLARGELETRGAVFVTLETDAGLLRGCVGVTAPLERNLVWETWRIAVSAALFDSRFSPVTAEELPDLRFAVTVLGKIEPVACAGELDPSVYGVVVSAHDGRRGLLLPGLPGVDSMESQLAIARQKGGIGASEPVRLERFTAVSFSERAEAPPGGSPHAG
jgi:AmmeMemoRadiSam system protein A